MIRILPFSVVRALVLGACVATALVAQQQPLPTWRLDSTPGLVIEEDGRPETEFLRIAGAWRVEGGRIAIANSASSEIRLFSPTGRLERTVGRQGSGPGEFQLILWGGRSVDTLFLYDPMLRRLTTVDLSGEARVVGTLRIVAQGGRESFEILGRLAGGQWLAKSTSHVGWDAPPGVHRKRDDIGVVRASGDGQVRWVADVLGMASFVFNPSGRIQEALLGPIAFSPWALTVASGGSLWYGESGKPEIMRYDPASARLQRIRLPLQMRQPSRELISSARAEEAQTDRRANRAFMDAKYSTRYLPTALPYFEDLIAADDGAIWVREYVGIRSAPASHLVIDRTGRLRARVAVPGGMRVTDIGRDYILGVYRNADGVESVRLYGLTRN